MSEVAARLAMSLIAKLVTETFLAKIIIYSLAEWAKQTDNELDNRVVGAMADALGVPVDVLKLPAAK